MNRTSIEMLEEGGLYTMKVKDSFMDPEDARDMAEKVLETIEESDWDGR